MYNLNPELTACPMVWKMMIAAIIVSRCHILLNILIITIIYAFAHFYSLFSCLSYEGSRNDDNDDIHFMICLRQHQSNRSE